MQEKKCEGLEFQAGDSVRVKTHGDGPFICKYLGYFRILLHVLIGLDNSGYQVNNFFLDENTC